jgi:carbon monoxide dehydrogenase subunit G
VKLEGSYTFAAPQEAVWQALLDPDVLARIMPGCERLEKVGDNEFRGLLKIRIGPMQGEFEGNVVLTDIDAPNGYRMRVNGRGPSGFMDGEGGVRLAEQEGATVMQYDGDVQVGGRIASVGHRLLDRSAKALTEQSLEQLNQQIHARQQAVTSEAPPPEIAAPTQTEFALGVAKNLLDDLAPPERRPQLIAGGAIALLALVMLRALAGWWANLVARRTAELLWEKEVRARKRG